MSKHMNEKIFNHAQLRRAISLVPSMSKKEIAQEIGVTNTTLSLYLSGSAVPCDRVMEKLSKIFVFPYTWYYLPESVSKPSCFSYNPKLSTSKRERSKHETVRDIVNMCADWLCNFVEITKPNLVKAPDFTLLRSNELNLSTKKLIEEVAEGQRSSWHLSNEPIQNLTFTCELNSIYCTYLNDIKPFSFWTGDGIPVVVLDKSKPLVASRFDLAVQLGHLILHKDINWRLYEKDSLFRKTIVTEAEYFASVFLLPTRGFLDSLPKNPTVIELKRAKPVWLTSIANMIKRAEEAGVIENSESMFVRLSQLDWRNSEPLDVGVEALSNESADFFNELSCIQRHHETLTSF
jgi:Zn-dependent peptidase ImmA (M78 family)/transcriptional regulator with XRE-family HTH domain